MKKNMVNFDRILRAGIGIALLVANIKGFISGPIAVAAVAVAVVFLLTSLFGFCPIYALFGRSGRKTH